MNGFDFLLWVLVVLGVSTFGMWASTKLGRELFIGLYATLTVVATIIAVKLVQVGPFIAPAGVIAYSATFLLTDVADEVWGKKFGYKIVMSGFLANLIAVSVIALAVHWQPAPFQDGDFQQMFASILGTVPRIFFASIIAYLISQNHDVWAFHYWKEKTGGKYLWLRNNASTIISQLLDTVIFITLAFYGTVPSSVLLQMIFGQYTLKVIIALLDTPFVYLAIGILEKWGGLDEVRKVRGGLPVPE